MRRCRSPASTLPYPLAVLRRCADQGDALACSGCSQDHVVGRLSYATVGLWRQSPLVVFGRRPPSLWTDTAIADSTFVRPRREPGPSLRRPHAPYRQEGHGRAGRLVGVRLRRSLAQGWLKQAMAEDELDAGLIRLAPWRRPASRRSAWARNIVCKCADVSDGQIGPQLAAGA